MDQERREELIRDSRIESGTINSDLLRTERRDQIQLFVN